MKRVGGTWLLSDLSDEIASEASEALNDIWEHDDPTQQLIACAKIILVERERCAKIADQFALEASAFKQTARGAGEALMQMGAVTTSKQIAAAIREGEA